MLCPMGGMLHFRCAQPKQVSERLTPFSTMSKSPQHDTTCFIIFLQVCIYACLPSISPCPPNTTHAASWTMRVCSSCQPHGARGLAHSASWIVCTLVGCQSRLWTQAHESIVSPAVVALEQVVLGLCGFLLEHCHCAHPVWWQNSIPDTIYTPGLTHPKVR